MLSWDFIVDNYVLFYNTAQNYGTTYIKELSDAMVPVLKAGSDRWAATGVVRAPHELRWALLLKGDGEPHWSEQGVPLGLRLHEENKAWFRAEVSKATLKSNGDEAFNAE